jgi:hypothetical protein
VTLKKASEGTPGRQITGGTSTRRMAWPRSVTLIIIREKVNDLTKASEDSLGRQTIGGLYTVTRTT